MNKIRVFISGIVLSLIMLIPAYGQFSLPVSVQIGGGIGYIFPAGDLGGTTMDYYSGSKYGLSNGLNLQGKVRFAIAGLNLAGEIDYSSLSNSGNSEPGQGNIDISQKILSIKLGPTVHTLCWCQPGFESFQQRYNISGSFKDFICNLFNDRCKQSRHWI